MHSDPTYLLHGDGFLYEHYYFCGNCGVGVVSALYSYLSRLAYNLGLVKNVHIAFEKGGHNLVLFLCFVFEGFYMRY